MVKLGTFDFPRLISFALTYLKIFSSPINFDNAFVAFMESAAMYLRFVKIKLWGQRKFFGLIVYLQGSILCCGSRKIRSLWSG